MIQKQALTFVLPTIWEDVKENSYLKSWIEKQNKNMSRLYAEILADRTFAQSWTSLAESDAMWRIYSYEKQSLRIKVDADKIKLLNSVIAEPVIYDDRYIDYSNSGLRKDEIFLKLIAQKRTAFSHEQEIRLIYVDVPEKSKLYPAIESMFIASDILNGKPTNIDIEDFGELVKKLSYLNLHHAKISHPISFAHIDSFISGVLVNPFASSWYVNTVKTYCDLNGIPFEGKSKLYEGEKHE